MKVTGQILRDNRERKNISISEVAIATKINVKTIVAMEAGDVDHLPPKTFLRGFVKAYATYLELDVDDIMATFFNEVGSTKPKPPETIATSPRGNSAEADRAINPKTSPAFTIGAIAGILILVVLIVLVKNKMESYEKEAVPGTPPTGMVALSNANGTAGVAASAGTAVGTPGGTSGSSSPILVPSPTSNPSPSSAPVSVGAVRSYATPAMTSMVPTGSPAANSVASAQTHSPTPTATPTVKVVATPKASPTASPNVSTQGSLSGVQAASSPTPTPTPTPKPTKTSEILIEALNDVTIDAVIDGEAKKISLAANAVQSIRAKKVILSLSDAGAVNLTVNGNDRGVPGDLGKPKRVTLP